MRTKIERPKNVGLGYKFGKGVKHIFSSVSGESDAAGRRVEDSAKDYILGHFFMPDIRKLLEDFNLEDPAVKKDTETGKIIEVHKSIDEYRKYVKEKVKLSELERYIRRNPQLTDTITLNGIKPSEISNYVRKVASINEEIHWTIQHVLRDLIDEYEKKFDPEKYRDFWLEEMRKNYGRFQYAVNNLRSEEGKLSELKFNPIIFESVINTSKECKVLYGELHDLIEKGTYKKSDLQTYFNIFLDKNTIINAQIGKISRINFELELNPNKQDLMDYLVEIRKIINNLFLSKFEKKLIEQDEPSLIQVSDECEDEKGFVVNLAALGNLIDKMNATVLKSFLKSKVKDGTINQLEQFLKENIPDYNPKIIKNLRDIMTLRNQWPIHDDTSRGIVVAKEIYGSYPPTDYKKFWSLVLKLYIESLTLLRSCLGYDSSL